MYHLSIGIFKLLLRQTACTSSLQLCCATYMCKWGGRGFCVESVLTARLQHSNSCRRHMIQTMIMRPLWQPIRVLTWFGSPSHLPALKSTWRAVMREQEGVKADFIFCYTNSKPFCTWDLLEHIIVIIKWSHMAVIVVHKELKCFYCPIHWYLAGSFKSSLWNQKRKNRTRADCFLLSRSSDLHKLGMTSLLENEGWCPVVQVCAPSRQEIPPSPERSTMGFIGQLTPGQSCFDRWVQTVI